MRQINSILVDTNLSKIKPKLNDAYIYCDYSCQRIVDQEEEEETKNHRLHRRRTAKTSDERRSIKRNIKRSTRRKRHREKRAETDLEIDLNGIDRNPDRDLGPGLHKDNEKMTRTA